MRPRRKILVYSKSEDEAGVLAFVLHTKIKFAPFTVSTSAEFTSALSNDEWQAAIIMADHDRRRTAQLTNACQRKRIPTLLISTDSNYESAFSMATIQYGATNAEIIERLDTISVRKRGPKKGCHWMKVDGKTRLMREVA